MTPREFTRQAGNHIPRDSMLTFKAISAGRQDEGHGRCVVTPALI